MKDVLISRQDAKVAMRKLKKWYVVCEEHTQKNIGLRYDDVMFTLDKLPSAQPEHLVKKTGNLVKGLVNDCISRQQTIDALDALCDRECEYTKKQRSFMCGACRLGSAFDVIDELPSVKTEKMQLSTEKTQLSEEDATKDATFDCISREDAIDAVKQHMNNVSGGTDEYYIAHRHIIELLQIVPTAEPESHREWYMHGYRDAQRWIPVTEALPEDDTEVNVSCTDDSGDSEFSYTTTGWHFKGIWVVGNERSYFVRAWMPLPEPYKEGQDE